MLLHHIQLQYIFFSLKLCVNQNFITDICVWMLIEEMGYGEFPIARYI